MKNSLFGLPDSKMTFMKSIDFARDNGIAAIEPYPTHEFRVPDKDAVAAAATLAEYAKENGVAISCFSMGINITTAPERLENIEKLKRYADVAAAMGSPYLHHTILPSLKSPKGLPLFEDLLKIAVSGIREVYDYAESVGVKAVYEDQGFVFNGADRFEQLLVAVERDIKIVADLGNIMFVGEKPEIFVGRFAPYIAHVHIKDYLKKNAGTNYPGEEWYGTRSGDYLRGTIVGHGTIDFVTCIRLLIESGYDGWYSLEYDGMEEANKAVKLSIRNLNRYYNEAKRLTQIGEEIIVPYT